MSKLKEKSVVRPDRAALIHEAVDQVKNGQVIPAEDIETWVESWDTPNERKAPEPRKR